MHFLHIPFKKARGLQFSFVVQRINLQEISLFTLHSLKNVEKHSGDIKVANKMKSKRKEVKRLKYEAQLSRNGHDWLWGLLIG